MPSKEIRGIAVVLTAALLTGASAYLYVGPYRWLAELQFAAVGTYSVKLSFLGAFVVCGTPLVFVRRMLEAQELGRAEDLGSPAWQAGLAVVRAAVTASPRAARAVLLGALLTLGGLLAARDLGAGPLVELDVSVLERGEAPSSRYVELVGGSLRSDRAERIARRSFVPYAAHEGAAAVVVEVRHADRVRVFEAPLEGTLRQRGLPGPVRVALEERGEITESHWVLRYGHDPEEGRMPLGVAAFGAVLFALGLTIVIRGRPRAPVA